MNKITLLILFSMVLGNLFSQSNLLLGVNYSYWEHSDLFGVEGNIKYSYIFQNNQSVSVSFSYGSGEKDGLSKFHLDPNIEATTLSHDFSEEYNFIGWENEFTDFARQLKINLNYNFLLFPSRRINFHLGVGAFLGTVQNFLIVDVLTDYELNVFPFYQGPINLILTSQNNFLVSGVAFNFSKQFNTSSKIDPVISLDVGIGPKKSSFIGLGILIGGNL